MQPLRDLLTAYNPTLAVDLRIVTRWQSAGADMERHILPVIREWTAKKPDIYSLGFFTPHIMRAVAADQPKPPVSDEQRARMIAFTVRKVGRRMPSEERWLAAYERDHGPVMLDERAKFVRP